MLTLWFAKVGIDAIETGVTTSPALARLAPLLGLGLFGTERLRLFGVEKTTCSSHWEFKRTFKLKKKTP